MAKNVIELIVRGKDFISPELGRMTKSLNRMKKSVFSLRSAFLALGAGFAAKNIKDLSLFTANVDLLRLSMEQLAKVNGINIKFLEANVIVMKSMGVATDDAIRSLNSFIRLNLDLTQATKFVRVAQDLAVISQKTTSKVVEQLTRGITTLNARMLRSAGVFFTAQQAAREWAKENKRTIASMTVAEKQAAVLNKIIEDGEKVTGAYEASLSLAGKKVLQLNRLWKEAKLALGEFTQDALMVGVESIQDFLKSIVTLRQEGRLDKFGKSMSDTLITVINAAKRLSSIIIGFLGTLFKFRRALLLVVEAFIAWKIISIIIASISSLNAVLIALQGDAIIPFLVSVQRLTVEFGLWQAATISLGTAITILGTAIVGLGIGKLLGDMISTTSVMKDLRDTILGADLPQEIKDFFQEWIFGALMVQELEKETTEALAKNTQARIALRLKEAKKIREELVKEELERRRADQARLDFFNTLDAISRLERKNLSKVERQLGNIAELRSKLEATVEALRSAEPGEIIDEEGIQEIQNVLIGLEKEFQEKLAEEKQKMRIQELTKVAEHSDSLAEVMEARIALFAEKAKSSASIVADSIIQIGQLVKKSIDDGLFALITGAETMESIWTNLWESMLKTVISAITSMIAQQLILLIASLIGIKTQAISETATNAAEIYGNSFASAAAIPLIGWLIAPGVAAANLGIGLAGMAAAAGAGAGVGAGIAAFAEGGIVDGPTLALIGEAGPEAVIPLDSPTASRRLEKQPINIGTQILEVFPNVTEGDALFNIPRTTLERWVRQDLIPVFDSLNERGFIPDRV